MADRWIKLTEHTPPDECGALLVTNNLKARDAFGKMSHLWLVGEVFEHSGDFYAFDGDSRVYGLTHWRYAIPEENRG